MNFYNRPKKRWPAVVGAVVLTLVVAFPVGLLVGRQTAPDFKEQTTDARDTVRKVAARLAVIETEYELAVKDEEVIEEVEYRGAQDRASRAVSEVEGLSNTFGLIDPQGYKQAVASVKELKQAVDNTEDVEQVKELVTETQEYLGQ